MGRFLLTTRGTAGDVLPFVRIGAELVATGHEAILVSHASFAAVARRAGIGFAAIDTEDTAGREYGADQLRHEVVLLARHHHLYATVLVGTPGSALPVLIAAEFLNAPAAWVALTPGRLTVTPEAALGERGGRAGAVSTVRAAMGLPPVADWASWLGAAYPMLGLWPDWFDRAGTPAPAGVQLTGFVTGDAIGFADAGLAGFPDDAGPGDRRGQCPLLVAGGAGPPPHPEFYRVALAGVAELGHPATVVAPRRELLPDRLPDGTVWQPRLSFPAVMRRAVAVLHHGGLGTAVRALLAGAPQVILAHGADRPDNAARFARLGRAQVLTEERWQPAIIAAALRPALADGVRDPVRHLIDEPESAAPARAAAALTALLPPGPLPAPVPGGGFTR
ncbi:nucleotide disphospho-sugar-binding domain-containing protein [Dactylosporangium sp. NPDC049525]|uniref:glycosyltransferase n=1 Tax=Dactylosporangium sp. NPDC049525 TaxID=3154730 RepID=UPI00342C232C